MAPSPSVEQRLTTTDSGVLLALAGASIVDGLMGRQPTTPSIGRLPVALRSEVGVFVTLTVEGELNGCVGTVQGVDPLGQAVCRYARAAAFSDPRLPTLSIADHETLEIDVSVLSPLSPVGSTSHEELVADLVEGVDGLLIDAGDRHAVFLPSVWEQLPEPDTFVDHLYRKAGLPAGCWPRGMQAHRFRAEKYRRSAVQAG